MTQAFNLSQLANRVNTSGQLDIATGVSGTLPIANGGTGQTTASNAINALLPSQTGNSGRYLTTNGTSASWGSVASFGGGTNVTSSTNVTLTNTSTQVQNITMTTSGLSVILPNATTLPKGVYPFAIYNAGGFPFSVKDNTGATLRIVNWGETALFALVDNQNSAGNWNNTQMLFGDVYLSTIQNFTGSERNTVALTSSTFVFAYRNNTDSQIYVVACTFSGGTATWGTPVNLQGGGFSNEHYIQSICRISNTSFSVVYKLNTGASSFLFRVRAGTVSGTTITIGNAVDIDNLSTSYGNGISGHIRINDTQFVLSIWGSSLGDVRFGNTRLYTISGTTITQNQSYSDFSGGGNVITAADSVLVDTNKFLHIRQYISGSAFNVDALVFTVSGTSWSQGTATSIFANTNQLYGSGTTYSISTNTAINGVFGFSFSISGTSVTRTALASGYSSTQGSATVTGNKLVRTTAVQNLANNFSSGILFYAFPTGITEAGNSASFSSTQGITAISSGTPSTLGFITYTVLP